MEVEIGKSATLECNHSMNSLFELEWRIETSTNTTVVSGQRDGQFPSYGKGFSRRTVAISFPEGDLILKSVKSDDAGKQYKCMFRQKSIDNYQQGGIYWIKTTPLMQGE